MTLTIHQLTLLLARHLGVTTFDPGDMTNRHPLLQPGARAGDLDAVLAALNGALQEIWALAPRGVRATWPKVCPRVTAAEVGAASDAGWMVRLPHGWEESVLYPLALRRLMTQPDFQPASAMAQAEIERQAAFALRILVKLECVRHVGSVDEMGNATGELLPRVKEVFEVRQPKAETLTVPFR